MYIYVHPCFSPYSRWVIAGLTFDKGSDPNLLLKCEGPPGYITEGMF